MSNEIGDQEFHLANAPIVEAVISINFAEPLQQSALSSLEECANRIQDVYPIKEEIRSQQFQMILGASIQPSIDAPRIQGFFCKMANGHRVVHLKLDGFGFSELTPYSSWDSFFPEAYRLWDQYMETVGARPADRWSIRYINRFSWPEGATMEDYLKVYPSVPEGLPQAIAGCFMRLQIPVEHPSHGLFTQQLFTAPPMQSGGMSVVLDHEFTYSALGLSGAALWDRIRQSRKTKNDFFRASLTDKALETFK